eukprot:tig00020961_g16717.t1
MSEAFLREYEQAAEDVSKISGPNPAGRAEAERKLLEFRRDPNAIPAAQYILEHSHQSSAWFHAALMLKEAVIREWPSRTPEDRVNLRNNLLGYVATRAPRIQAFVRSQLIHVIALMFKRGWVENSAESCTALFSAASQLINVPQTRITGLELLAATVNEFSSQKATAVGLTNEWHHQSRKSFESEALKQAMKAGLSVLSDWLRAVLAAQKPGSALEGETAEVCRWGLMLLAAVLNWEFGGSVVQSGGGSQLIRPGKAWADVLLSPDTSNLLFSLYEAVRERVTLASAARQCLVQLASVSGTIFEGGDAARAAYLAHFARHTVALLTTHVFPIAAGSPEDEEEPDEAIDLAQLLLRLVTNFRTRVLVMLPPADVQAFLSTLATFTLKCMPPPLRWWRQALDPLLEAWLLLVGEMEELAEQAGALRQFTRGVFQRYVEAHLLVARAHAGNDELDDEHFDDKTQRDEELAEVAAIARVDAAHSLALLHRLLSEAVGRLAAFVQQRRSSGAPSPEFVQEELEWLGLLAGHVLADEGRGERPQVPPFVMQASAGAAAASGGRVEADPVVALVQCLFSYVDLENRCLEQNPSDEAVSPVVARTWMWTLRRWAGTYLMPDESSYDRASAPLVAAFGRASPSAAQVLNSLLFKIRVNFVRIPFDPDISLETARLLLGISNNAFCRQHLPSSEEWGRIAHEFQSPGSAVHTMTPKASRTAMEALVRVAVAVDDPARSHALFAALVAVPQASLANLLQRPDGDPAAQRPETLQAVTHALHLLRGVARVVGRPGAGTMFAFFDGLLDGLVRLFERYQAHWHIVLDTLKLLVDLVDVQLPSLPAHQTNRLCAACWQVLRIYSAHHTGRLRAANTLAAKAAAEEEEYRDILALLRLLTHLLQKDYLDLAPHAAPDQPQQQDVSDVVLHGINIVIPLISLPLLQYPKLCDAYYKLATYMLEVYPDKVLALPAPLFTDLIKSIEYGILQEGFQNADVGRSCLEALSALASNQLKKGPGAPAPEAYYAAAGHLAALLLERVVTTDANAELADATADALLLMFLSHQAAFAATASALVAKQTHEPSRARLAAALQTLAGALQAATVPANAKVKAAFRSSLGAFQADVHSFLRTR